MADWSNASLAPVIDFIIKSHKYKSNGAETAKARSGGALAAAGRLPSMLEEAESALKDLNAEMNRRRSAGSVWLGFARAAVVGAGLMWLVLQATGG